MLVRDCKSLEWVSELQLQDNFDQAHPSKYLSLDLVDVSELYHLEVIDLGRRKKHTKCGVLILPRGREREFMFSDPEGQKSLAEQSGFSRLIIVSILQVEPISMEQVQKQLNPYVRLLCFRDSDKVPYLTLGDSLGIREILFHRDGILIEDVKTDEKQETWFRRMIFDSRPSLIQTECVLDEKKQVIYQHLSSGYQKVIVSAIAGLSATKACGSRCLLVGLGGGSLPMFLNQFVSKCALDIVELDPQVFEMAKKFFGFIPDDNRLRVHIYEGCSFIRDLYSKDHEERQDFDAIIIDVDTKDASSAMSCPPGTFVEKSFLECVQQCLSPDGALIINLSCRLESSKKSVIDSLSQVFSQVYLVKVDDDVNEIVIASGPALDAAESFCESSITQGIDGLCGDSIRTALSLLLKSVAKRSKLSHSNHGKFSKGGRGKTKRKK